MKGGSNRERPVARPVDVLGGHSSSSGTGEGVTEGPRAAAAWEGRVMVGEELWDGMLRDECGFQRDLGGGMAKSW